MSRQDGTGRQLVGEMGVGKMAPIPHYIIVYIVQGVLKCSGHILIMIF